MTISRFSKNTFSACFLPTNKVKARASCSYKSRVAFQVSKNPDAFHNYRRTALLLPGSRQISNIPFINQNTDKQPDFLKVVGLIGFVAFSARILFSYTKDELEPIDNRTKKELNRRQSDFSEMEARATKAEEIKVAFLNFLLQSITDNPRHQVYCPKYEWKKRILPTLQLIQKDSPDILGFCEINHVQIEDLHTKLPSLYKVIGYSYDEHLGRYKTLEEYLKEGSLTKADSSQEFIGLVVKKDKFQIEQLVAHHLEDPKHEKTNRFLVEIHLKDLTHQNKLVILVTHFDHRSIEWRKSAGEYELALIKKFESQSIPWFSLGDRNWFPDKNGEEHYQEYVKEKYICDCRDGNVEKHRGPYGSFPAHLKDSHIPKIIQIGGKQVVDANMLDVCFRSRNMIEGIGSYAYTGEFNPSDYSLRPNNDQGDLSERNFISDHYYVGGIFKIKRKSQ